MSYLTKDQLEINFLPIDSFRGYSYPQSYIKFKNIEYKENYTVNEYIVESESSQYSYNVNIYVSNKVIFNASCSCARFKSGYNCKHIAAVVYRYGEEIIKKSYNKEQATNNILNMFYEKNKTNHIKKELKLSVSLNFNDEYSYYSTPAYLQVKIGDKKMYNLNKKAKSFFEVYNGLYDEFKFGKDLIYNNDEYYFSLENRKLLEFLKTLMTLNSHGYYRSDSFALDFNGIKSFLDLTDGKTFKVNETYSFNNINKENPYIPYLSNKKGIYHFSLKKPKDLIELNEKYAIYNNEFYEVPENIIKLKRMMYDSSIDELVFKESKLDLFARGILKNVKNNIELDDSVKDKIIIVSKPDVKLYFDFNYNSITCDIKLLYGNKEINYFDESNEIVRDNDYEMLILQDLNSFNFSTEEKPINISDMDLIGDFLEDGISKLALKYNVFTSQKLKETNIKKDIKVVSTFSIGKDNIMNYSFDLDGVDNSEIVNILGELKKNKRYYKLKSGDIINLENNNLNELDSLIDNMDLNEKDIKKGYGVVPKYKAIYLDSLKDNYHIIETNNLFDKLIKDFNSYKNVILDLAKKDKKILRDYQITGVNWLYNIYKCGFGGILADEMGLGKSIQLIYFIKEVIKEKKDAKILIVAPTSLVYNWSNEFDKFGSELKYKVLAENKNKRHEELNNLNDINVLITTYGLVREDREYYENMYFEIIAIDEAQNIKNNMAQMTRIIKSLNSNAKFALTGTPIENSVLELWSIFDFIMPGYLVSLLSFNKKYGIKNMDDDSLKILDSLKKQIRPFILRRKKKDVVKELPDKIENNIFIELNKEQKKIYLAELEKTKKKMEDLLRDDVFNKSRIEILKLLTRLRQICIDPSIVYENYKGGSCKLEELIPMIKDVISNGHKILLFSTYKTAIDIVNRELTNNDISCYVIDGSVSSKKRMELVDKFNNDNTNVFLITLKAGGTGLNLTAADVVIHLDLWWNPQAENQATDRAHRIGQKNTVEVIKLICKGTIEEKILELQNKKKLLSDNLIEGDDIDKNIMSKLTSKDIKKLLSMDNDDEK